MELIMGDGTIRCVRSAVEGPDAYDRHAALITVDGEKVADLDLDHSIDITVSSGHHEVGVRLHANFGTAKADVDVADGAITTVRCDKAHSARNQVLHPSHYWRLTIEGP